MAASSSSTADTTMDDFEAEMAALEKLANEFDSTATTSASPGSGLSAANGVEEQKSNGAATTTANGAKKVTPITASSSSSSSSSSSASKPSASSSSTSSVPSSGPTSKGVKRPSSEVHDTPTKKQNTASNNTSASSSSRNIIVAAAASASAHPPSSAATTDAYEDSAYAQLVAADRAAIAARHSSSSSSSAANSSSSSSSGEVYIPGQIYNGWLASLTATGEPCWLEATPENITAHALRAQQLADQEAMHQAALKKQSKAVKEAAAAARAAVAAAANGGANDASNSSRGKHLRTAAGKVWDDPTLDEWPENDFRIFCGDLGNDVTDALLTSTFQRWPSFVRAQVMRDKRTGKTRGYGFASFMSFEDFSAALKEIDGKYVGTRPISLKKSDWTKREASKEKSWTAKHNQFGNAGTRGDKKLHLY